MATLRTLTFADMLKRYRTSTGLTQEALAAAARLSVRCISDLERGIKRAPRKDTVRLLAQALHLEDAERASFEAGARSRRPQPSATQTRGVAAQTSSAPSLVGRRHERAVVERFLRDGPPVLFVTGEPGIGKTRLLQDAMESAGDAGWVVLRGGMQRLGGLAPYAPLVNAICRFITRRTQAQRRDDLKGCGWLVRLLPELAETPGVAAPDWKVPPEQERRLMFAAAARFLENVTGPAGTLLVLDDLQWAGPDALDLLVSLARGARDSSLRMLCAYRDTEIHAGAPLAGALADLVHAETIQQIRLGPLHEGEAAELLGSLLPSIGAPTLAEQVLRRSGGVPFYLVSCAQALQSHGDGDGDAPAVPWNVAQSISQRVTALPPTAQDLLSAAAVAGRRVSRPLLLALAARAGHDERTVIEALDAASQARLLVEDGNDSYQFAHELIREAIAIGLSAAKRAVLHRYVAETLEARGGEDQLGALAYHYARAGDEEKTLVYLERAADRATAMQAYGATESYCRDLVARLDARGENAWAARVREKLGAALMTAAHYDDALHVFEAAASTYRATDDVEGLCRTMAQIGWVHALRGTPNEGIARLQPLPDPLNTSRLSSLGLAQLYVALAQLYAVSGKHQEQLQAAERAATLAAAAKDTTLLARAEMRYGTALLMLGRIEEGFHMLDAALRSIEATGDLRNLCWTINNIGVVYEVRGDFTTTRRYVERAMELAERLADPTVLAFMLHRRGINSFYMGDWESARADLERALDDMRGVAASATAAYPPLGLGQLCLACGEWEAADQLLAAAETLARPRGDLQALYLIHSMLAERELLEGRAAAARDRLLPFFDERASEQSDVAVLLPRLAWAYAELGEMELAEALIERAVAEATAEQNRFDLVDGLCVEALVRLRQGRDGAAEQTLHAALTLTRDMRYPYGEARVLYWLGRIHTHCDEHGSAYERLQAAQAILQRLGERLYGERVEALLAIARSQSEPAR